MGGWRLHVHGWFHLDWCLGGYLCVCAVVSVWVVGVGELTRDKGGRSACGCKEVVVPADLAIFGLRSVPLAQERRGWSGGQPECLLGGCGGIRWWGWVVHVWGGAGPGVGQGITMRVHV